MTHRFSFNIYQSFSFRCHTRIHNLFCLNLFRSDLIQTCLNQRICIAFYSYCSSRQGTKELSMASATKDVRIKVVGPRRQRDNFLKTRHSMSLVSTLPDVRTPTGRQNAKSFDVIPRDSSMTSIRAPRSSSSGKRYHSFATAGPVKHRTFRKSVPLQEPSRKVEAPDESVLPLENEETVSSDASSVAIRNFASSIGIGETSDDSHIFPKESDSDDDQTSLSESSLQPTKHRPRTRNRRPRRRRRNKEGRREGRRVRRRNNENRNHHEGKRRTRRREKRNQHEGRSERRSRSPQHEGRSDRRSPKHRRRQHHEDKHGHRRHHETQQKKKSSPEIRIPDKPSPFLQKENSASPSAFMLRRSSSIPMYVFANE